MIGHDRVVLGAMFAVVGRQIRGEQTTFADDCPTLTGAQRLKADLAADGIAAHIEIDVDLDPLAPLAGEWLDPLTGQTYEAGGW